MDMLAAVFTVAGLAVFEIISSIDNAVINAEVMAKMSEKARRWFLHYGLLFAVFGIRFTLPLLILWMANPSYSPADLLMSAFSDDPKVAEAVEASAPLLLVSGGIFLVFLFFHWLFLEPKNFGLHGEKFFLRQGVWFYAVVSILLAAVTGFALQINPMMAFGAVVGSTAFFIIHGFKQNAAEQGRQMLEGNSSSHMGDWSKIFYLEAIDATFSIDGVIGAFAYTMAIPLILLGSGLGAFVVREMTIRNIETVKKYKYLKNGAMYSILFLGAVMLADAFGMRVPFYATPLATFAIIGYFFYLSKIELGKAAAASA
ncbi:Uncharacterised protein [uncultured archaeon]|nr:Uncharacterised protein [uncultured archaeon]